MSTDALPLPDLSTLPDDPATLRQLLQALEGERDQREKLQHHMDLLLRRLYGRSSEKVDPWQHLLFDGAPGEEPVTTEPAAAVLAAEPTPEAPGNGRRGHGRRPKPDH